MPWRWRREGARGSHRPPPPLQAYDTPRWSVLLLGASRAKEYGYDEVHDRHDLVTNVTRWQVDGSCPSLRCRIV